MSNPLKKSISTTVACLLLLSILSACGQNNGSQALQQTTENTVQTTPTVNIAEKIEAVYDACVASVVQIRSEANVLGYGTVITEDGYILTTREVAAGKNSFTLVFHDGNTRKATLTNVETDFAILKTDAKNLSPATFLNVDTFITGDIIFALQFDSAANQFSAISSSILSPNQTVTLSSGMTEELIRTHIAIDNTFSGAPLFDLAGNVIGILNTQYPYVKNDIITYSHGIAMSKLQSRINNMLAENELENNENSDPFQDNIGDIVVGEEYESTLNPLADKLTWAKINAIPIASNAMTEDQLRQICLDFMRLQLTFAWKPKETTTFSNSNSNTKTFGKNMVYGGIPYVSSSFGNLYKLMDFYDENTGTLDLSGGKATFKTIGNQCSASTFWSWNRVCSSSKFSYTADAVVKNGCLRVGPYTYDNSLSNFSKTTTKDICQNNGEQIMYKSYAATKPADGIVCSTPTGGHMRMISAKPNVVYNSDGTIDGRLSTITYMDQIANWSESTQSNGAPYEIEGGLNVTVSFYALYRDNYIPFTFAELNKDKAVAKGSTSLSHKDNTITPANLANSKISSNYAISSVRTIVTNAQGNEIYNKNIIAASNLDCSYSMVSFIEKEALQKLAGNGCQIQVLTRIGTGEEVSAYTGTLVS